MKPNSSKKKTQELTMKKPGQATEAPDWETGELEQCQGVLMCILSKNWCVCNKYSQPSTAWR